MLGWSGHGATRHGAGLRGGLARGDGPAGGMMGRQISKGQGRPEGDAGADIVAASEARGVVADGVEALDGLSIGVERPGVLVDGDAGEGAETADMDLDGVEGGLFERSQIGMGSRSVAIGAAIGGFTLAEIG